MTTTTTCQYDSKSNLISTDVSSTDRSYSKTTCTYSTNGNFLSESYKDSDGEKYEISYTYNKNGDVLKETHKGSDDSDYTVKNTYNKNGQLIKKVSEAKNDPDMNYSYEYTYDKKGNLTKSVYTSEEDKSVETVKYNSNGDKTEEVTVYNDGSSDTEKYTYNSKGLLSKTVLKYADGDVETTTYKYNNAGKPTVKETKDNDGNVEYRSTYTYDTNGRLTEKTNYLSSGLAYTEKFEYNEQGLLTKEMYCFDDALKDIGQLNLNIGTEYFYDGNGRLIKVINNNPLFGNNTEEYTYDNSGKLVSERSESNSGTVTEKKYQSFSLNEKAMNDTIFNPSIRLSTNTYTYTGKAKTPTVIITYSDGTRSNYSKGRCFKVSYSNNTNIGTATAKITFTEEFDHKPITLTYKIVPAAPSGIKASSRTASSVSLSWDQVNGAAKYEVYVKNTATGKYELKTTVSSNKATVKNLSSGTNYSFKIKAVDASGKYKSSYSSVYTATTRCDAPTLKATSPSKKTVNISWNAVNGATSYTIYYATSKNGEFKALKTVTETNYTHTKFTSGSTRYIKVVANRKTASGTTFKSEYSNTVKIKVN